MAAPWHFIKRKVEDGFGEVLDFLAGTNLGTGVSIVKGLAGNELTCPRVEIIAHSGTPEVVGDTITGNWLIELSINVVSDFNDDDRDTHEERCGYVQDVVMRDDIPAQFTSTGGVTDLTVFNGTMGWLPGPTEDAVNGDTEYMSSYNVTVYCAPTTF